MVAQLVIGTVFLFLDFVFSFSVLNIPLDILISKLLLRKTCLRSSISKSFLITSTPDTRPSPHHPHPQPPHAQSHLHPPALSPTSSPNALPTNQTTSPDCPRANSPTLLDIFPNDSPPLAKPLGPCRSGFGPFSPRLAELISCCLTRTPNCSTSSYRAHAWSRLSGSCAATARRCFGALEKCQSTLPDLSDRQLGKLLFMATLFNIRSMRWGWAYVSPVPCTSAPSRPTTHDGLLHIRRLSSSSHHGLFGPILRGRHSCCAAARI